MTQELDPDISRPYLRIFNQECLYLSRVSSLVCSQIFPLLHLHWVSITDTNPERSNHAGEEFVVGKDESIDPDIFRKLNNDELILRRAFGKHIGILILNQHTLRILRPGMCFQNRSPSIKRSIREALLARLPRILTPILIPRSFLNLLGFPFPFGLGVLSRMRSLLPFSSTSKSPKIQIYLSFVPERVKVVLYTLRIPLLPIPSFLLPNIVPLSRLIQRLLLPLLKRQERRFIQLAGLEIRSNRFPGLRCALCFHRTRTRHLLCTPHA